VKVSPMQVVVRGELRFLTCCEIIFMAFAKASPFIGLKDYLR